MDKNQNENYHSRNDGVSGFDYERFIMEEEAANSVANKRKTAKPGATSDTAAAPDAKDSELYDWMRSLVTAFVVCIIVFAFLVREIGIIGQSMEPTFSNSDRVIISDLFFTPKQGDVVVLRKLTFQKEPIIKRVIATEGQTVDIDFENGIVYVDDQPMNEPYIAELTRQPLDFNGKITVPENCIFVMGDNRNNSTDSRSSMIGCVDERYIMGKVLIRVLPINEFGVVD